MTDADLIGRRATRPFLARHFGISPKSLGQRLRRAPGVGVAVDETDGGVLLTDALAAFLRAGPYARLSTSDVRGDGARSPSDLRVSVSKPGAQPPPPERAPVWLQQLARLSICYASPAALAEALGADPDDAEPPRIVAAWLTRQATPNPAQQLEIGRLYERHAAHPDLVAESLIAAEQTCEAVLQMESIGLAHDQARRCRGRLARLRERLADAPAPVRIDPIRIGSAPGW